jgi:hypothetical protein
MFSGISRLFFHIARRISFLEATSENSIQANFAEFLFHALGWIIMVHGTKEPSPPP